MKHISLEVTASINKEMVEKYSKGEDIRIRDRSLLESAVHRPLQTMFGESLYKDIFEKAIALFESLAKNHAFENANKRTAFACMAYFLFINGHVCVMSEKDAANLTVDFVVGKISFEDVIVKIKKHSYRKSSK